MAQALVTVYRSMESSAGDDAEEIRELLAEVGFAPVILRDDAPGVPVGAVEVRVPADQADRADALIGEHESSSGMEAGDPSHALDMEAVFDGMGATAEMEAMGIKGVLDANGIPNVLVGATPYPSLRFLVRVPRQQIDRARQALAEAEAAGPAAADEAELAGEQ